MNAQNTLKTEIAQIDLVKLLKLVGSRRADLELHLSSENQSATIHIKNGRVIHTEIGEDTGKTGLFKILSLQGGSYSLEKLGADPTKSINQPLQSILNEAMGLGVLSEGQTVYSLSDLSDTDVISSLAVSRHGEAKESKLSGSKVTAGPQASQQIPIDIEVENTTSKESASAPVEVAHTIDPSETGTQKSSEDLEESLPEYELKTETLSHEIHQSNRLLETAIISEGFEHSVSALLNLWNHPNAVSANELNYDSMPEYLHKHMEFQVETSLLRVINVENRNIDTSQQSVALAISKFFSEVKSSWKISKEHYEDMVRYAVGFELATAFDPARALGEFVMEYSNGTVSDTLFVLNNLKLHRIIGDELDDLNIYLNKEPGRFVHQRRLINLIRGLYFKRPKLSAFNAMRAAVTRMFEVINIGSSIIPEHIQTELLIQILEGFGLPYEAGILRSKSNERNHFTLDEVQELTNITA